jgi:serine/threonine protein phosphatase PrpC
MESALTSSHGAAAGHPAARKPGAEEIDVYGLTHQGLLRSNNQDHFLIGSFGETLEVHLSSLPGTVAVPLPAERNAFLAMVADGVGSSTDGAEASRLAVGAVALYVAESTRCYFAQDAGDDVAFTRALEEAALHCHGEILRRAAEASAAGDANGARHTMATTLTVWMGVWPKAYLLQVGDSRYYVLRDGELTQVSRDQTIAQELVDQGVLTEDDAARSRWAHVLFSAIGGPSTAPVVTGLQNDWNHVHLLCSDGLTKHVSDERIRERLLHMTSAQQACEALLADALDDGGTDNITIIIGRAVRPAPPAGA